ncbi:MULTISPECIES: penicillin-binding protein 2 [Gemmobacter]|uniref:Cell division protein FtsI (Penicillin-binding protein 3) n=2 Tax=Gemmobacter TaxID=204456 RepID=A0A2T6AYW9_9RHOB|nr:MULTISPECIES: penicillin-binding protein 2 [Gemmobacter]OJY35205.1 MAG: cell division protein FtsI [Rhodobacterales bacterium 65-51]PTX49003.1 cell division protein FtsI (penicillin-binding protein 3) [Gemmobacter caeni]TWI98996.1 cell division protein FtsI (penicillin-binding protein 3) [Gemmobacter caeni]GHC31580.1 cell division protein FtsI [Gemmobacter nanjingensis]
MTRTPLRPLARILSARAAGENPDSIERENLRARHEVMREKSRKRSEGRLLILGLSFFMAFTVVGARMGLLAASEPMEPRSAAPGAAILAQRADITDRNGRVMATNLVTHALYAQPKDMVDPERVARELAVIFPDLKEEDLHRRLTDGRSFLWIKKKLSPEQMQKVHEIGDPGLLFGPREMRLYPNGRLAAHVLGGASFGTEGVNSAEVIGTAGLEKFLDDRLRDPAQTAEPLQLSLDLTLQSAVTEVLDTGMKMMNAKGAAAVLMDVRTGEILSLVSLPDFDPNDRPNPLVKGDPGDSPLFNRAVQGVYELGSTFKIFAVAQALELGLVKPDTLVDANAPMVWGKFRIKEFRNHNYGPYLSVADVIAKSSNVGTAHVALMVGGLKQQAFLKTLGFFEPTPIEMVEAKSSRPLVQKNWSDIVTITVSYGHGLSASPMHLAAAYSAIANGGVAVPPTLLRRKTVPEGTRVMSERVARQAVDMLAGVVEHGTASYAKLEGYAIAGKTGTADKPKPTGGYYKDKVINTFASMFPADNPRYVLIVTLDEPVDTSGSEPRRTAGYTAVPVAAEVVRRVAPLLGIRPKIELPPANALTAVVHN